MHRHPLIGLLFAALVFTQAGCPKEWPCDAGVDGGNADVALDADVSVDADIGPDGSPHGEPEANCADGLDDDGDGEVDEGPGFVCGPMMRFQCIDGEPRCALVSVEPGWCDGVDGDADGLVDEGAGLECTTACGTPGVRQCWDGAAGPVPRCLSSGAGATVEANCANGSDAHDYAADDDCDGPVDEYAGIRCDADGDGEPDDVYACLVGAGGGGTPECRDLTLEERCGDGEQGGALDDDGDGEADEGLGLSCRACTFPGTWDCIDHRFVCVPENPDLPLLGTACDFGQIADPVSGERTKAPAACTARGTWRCGAESGQFECLDAQDRAFADRCSVPCDALGEGERRDGLVACDGASRGEVYCQPIPRADGFANRFDARNRLIGAPPETCAVDNDCDGLVGYGPPCNGCPVETLLPGQDAVGGGDPKGWVCVPPSDAMLPPPCVVSEGDDGPPACPAAPGFTMGSPPEEPDRIDGLEVPFEASTTRTLLVRSFEVTRSEWNAVASLGRTLDPPVCLQADPIVDDPCAEREGGAPPPLPFDGCVPGREGADCPAVGVTWLQAATWLNLRTHFEDAEALEPCYRCVEVADGQHPLSLLECPDSVQRPDFACTGYRLLTEAEWEYAARSGGHSEGALYGESSLDAIAWYVANSLAPGWGIPCDRAEPEGPKCGPLPVGRKPSNIWGIYDILGNATEWVADHIRPDVRTRPLDEVDPLEWYDEPAARVSRGGGWIDLSIDVRLAARRTAGPMQVSGQTGFRYARTLLLPPVPAEP